MWGQRRDDASTYLPTYPPPPTQPPPPRVFYSRSSSPRFLYVRILPSLVFFPSSLDFPSNSFVSPPSPSPLPSPFLTFFLRPRCSFFSPPPSPFFLLTFLWGWLHPSCGSTTPDDGFERMCCCSAVVKYARGSMMSEWSPTRCYIIDNDCLGVTWVDDALYCK